MATDWQSRRDGFDHRRDKPLDRPINWKYWGSLPELKQWDACALSVNVNPENLKTRRMVMPGMPVFLPESFPNRAVELEFQMRLTMFGRVIGGRPLATVSPAQFAAWCLDVGLENLPPELVAMATPEPRPAPVDWEPYRFREQFTLFELACLAYRKEPASVFNDSWLAIRKHGGIASEVLNNPEAAAAMFYGNPTMYFSPPVGEALERMKKATGLQPSGTLSVEKARSLASVLGLTFPPELSAAPGQQAPAPQDATPSAAPVVAESASGEPVGPSPLTTGDIAFCFAGLRWDEKGWKKPLGDKRKWLEACIVIPGQRGVSETRWNPVCIGAALERQGHVTANSMRARFQTRPHLIPWLDAWKTYEADYLVND